MEKPAPSQAPVITLSDLLQATSGTLLHTGVGEFYGVGTDTRQSLQGQLFFALRGDRFDAHNFLAQAVANGARGLVIDQDVTLEPFSAITVIKVKDTLRAFQDLALHMRRRLPAKVCAVTGSNGKTTVKMFLATLLENHYRVHWTGGSLNNHWGVPITLLGTPPATEWTVLEMGMNHLGEILRLCQIGEPDVVAVSMVGWAHIENLGSQEKIAEAKNEIYVGAKPNATRVYNVDNSWTRAMYEQHMRQYGSASAAVTFSNVDANANVFVKFTDATFSRVEGHIYHQPFTSPVGFFGEHNVVNLACAIAMACACEEPAHKIIQALPRCSTGWGRNQWLALPSGARALFDAYNANPDSMRALLENTRKLPGRKFAILGDMRELGPYSERFHVELGQQAAAVGFDTIWFVGDNRSYFERGLKSSAFDKNLIVSATCEESLAQSLGGMLSPGDVVVIKASRGVGLEQVLRYWGVSLAKN